MATVESGDLRSLVGQASWVTLNDCEWQLMQQKTGLTAAAMTRRVKALNVPHGARGSVIFTEDGMIEIPAAASREVVDPTGCGDAYRAGLLPGLCLA